MEPSLRRSLYALMLVAATGVMVGRVANVEFLYEPSLFKAYPKRNWPGDKPPPFPTFGSNDRSRWATVKALVEEGTFVIGRRVPDPAAPKGYTDEGILFPGNKGYGSVDVVLHPDRQEFYSTKPPLLTLFTAGQYWVLHHAFHKNIDDQKWEVVVPILLLTNVLPLVLALWLLSRLLEAYGTTDWGRLFTFAAACFGTFLPTFAITLNNHVPAACCVMFAAYVLLRPARPVGDEPGSPRLGSPGRWLLAGLFAGLAVSLDLASAAFAGVLGLVILSLAPRGLVWYAPAMLLPVVFQSWVSYQAVGTWEPVYAKFGTDWYEYPGSHWEKHKLWREGQTPRPEGIDFADEPKGVYAFHFLVGHHGYFSLTPLWLLAGAGMGLAVRQSVAARRLHLFIPLVLLVVLGFYILRTNNYGGWTSGPRWLFWLTPLMLLALVPAADRLGGSRTGRGVGYLCLGVSAFSAAYPWNNPWRHPWIYQWCEYMDWVRY